MKKPSLFLLPLLGLLTAAFTGTACSSSSQPNGSSASSSSASSSSGGEAGGAGGKMTTGSGGGGSGGAGTAGNAGTGGGGGAAGGGGAGGGNNAMIPLPGFGMISGACGVIDAMQINSPDPIVYRDVIDFGIDVYDRSKLSPGGQVIYDIGNLGGSSLESEIMSYEVLYRCELAKLLKTESEIIYTDPMGKKTDLLVDIDAFQIGVSVTRAYVYPPGTPYTQQMAYDLLNKKLSDIHLSTANVSPQDGWPKQILHVLAYTAAHADTMEAAYATVDAAVRGDTILWLTVTEGNDAFIY